MEPEKEVLIQVYCGKSIEQYCRQQLHPYNEVLAAKKIVDLKKSTLVYSNCPDFVSAIKYYGEKKGVVAEFFLDGKSVGNDINAIFEDFNTSLDLIHELAPSPE